MQAKSAGTTLFHPDRAKMPSCEARPSTPCAIIICRLVERRQDPEQIPCRMRLAASARAGCNPPGRGIIESPRWEELGCNFLIHHLSAPPAYGPWFRLHHLSDLGSA